LIALIFNVHAHQRVIDEIASYHCLSPAWWL